MHSDAPAPARSRTTGTARHRSKNGAPDADTFARLLPDLNRLCRILAPSRDAAEDLAQEAALRVWAQLASGTEIESLRPYLMTAARNGARRPAQMPEELTEALAPCIPPEAPARLATAEVLEAIARLPRAQAILISDHAFGGLSYQALAAEHALPLGTVMSRLNRARRALRIAMDLEPDESATALLADAG